MRVRALIFTILVSLLLPVLPSGSSAEAQVARSPYYYYDNAIRLRVGLLTPDGDSEYWQDRQLDFTGNADDFEDAAVGLDYIHYLKPRIGLLVGLQGFEGASDAAYLDFVDDRGFDIVHRAVFETTSVELGLVLHLADRRSTISPYIGGGGGFYSYNLLEDGDFIDFSFTEPEIFNDFFEAEGTAIGGFAVAGVDVPLGESLALFVEGRWQFADDELEDDFEGFGQIDLSSQTIAAGLTWSF